MSFDHGGAQASAGEMIRYWGGDAQLLRSGTLRGCKAAVLDYNPRSRALALEGAERVLIAADGLTVPPDHELDKFIQGGKKYQIVEAPKGPRPGLIPMYYDCVIVYEGAYP